MPGNPESPNPVITWFGTAFGQLAPELQQLHREGGQLRGPVTIRTGTGLAGRIGKKLAGKLNVPLEGESHQLEVRISHTDSALLWSRCFDNSTVLESVFVPTGQWPDGDWYEKTGSIKLKLGVDIIEGGWYWRPRGISWRGLPLPQFLLPRTTAWKRIENGRYRFYVGLSLPLLGELLSWTGLLELVE